MSKTFISPFVTIEEVAKTLNRQPKTIYNWMAAKRCPFRTELVGGLRQVIRQDFERYLRSLLGDEAFGNYLARIYGDSLPQMEVAPQQPQNRGPGRPRKVVKGGV